MSKFAYILGEVITPGPKLYATLDDQFVTKAYIDSLISRLDDTEFSVIESGGHPVSPESIIGDGVVVMGPEPRFTIGIDHGRDGSMVQRHGLIIRENPDAGQPAVDITTVLPVPNIAGQQVLVMRPDETLLMVSDGREWHQISGILPSPEGIDNADKRDSQEP